MIRNNKRSLAMWRHAAELSLRNKEVMVVLADDFSREAFKNSEFAASSQNITTMERARAVIEFIDGEIKYRFNPNVVVLIDPHAIEQHYGAILTEYLRYGGNINAS